MATSVVAAATVSVSAPGHAQDGESCGAVTTACKPMHRPPATMARTSMACARGDRPTAPDGRGEGHHDRRGRVDEPDPKSDLVKVGDAQFLDVEGQEGVGDAEPQYGDSLGADDDKEVRCQAMSIRRRRRNKRRMSSQTSPLCRGRLYAHGQGAVALLALDGGTVETNLLPAIAGDALVLMLLLCGHVGACPTPYEGAQRLRARLV